MSSLNPGGYITKSHKESGITIIDEFELTHFSLNEIQNGPFYSCGVDLAEGSSHNKEIEGHYKKSELIIDSVRRI